MLIAACLAWRCDYFHVIAMLILHSVVSALVTVRCILLSCCKAICNSESPTRHTGPGGHTETRAGCPPQHCRFAMRTPDTLLFACAGGEFTIGAMSYRTRADVLKQ